MCGESWLAIKDSLIHHPSSQGWASLCPLVISYVSYNCTIWCTCTCVFVAMCVLFIWVAFLSFLLLCKLVCYTHVFPCVYTCTCTCTCTLYIMFAYMYVYMYMYMCVYLYLYMYMYIVYNVCIHVHVHV